MRDQLLSNAATARSLGAWLLTSDRRAGSPEVKDRWVDEQMIYIQDKRALQIVPNMLFSFWGH